MPKITHTCSQFRENVAKELPNHFKTTIPLPVIDLSIKVKWRAKVAVHQQIVQDKLVTPT
jgi:hypothetical protein